MKYLAVLKFIVFHNMVVLLAAMWTAIVGVVGSAVATWMAYPIGDFTLLRYWTVSAAVVDHCVRPDRRHAWQGRC